MNSGDTIQIEAPDFDLDINKVSSPTMDNRPNKLLTQGTASHTDETTKPEIECSTPATSTQQIASQDTDWPDAIPVEIPPQIDQPEDQGIDTRLNVIPTELKFQIWKRIQKKNSMPI